MKWTEAKPAELPVNVLDVRDLLELGEEVPTILPSLIKAATAYAETAMGRSLIQRAITATFYAGITPPDLLYLPRGPIISITSVTPAGGTALPVESYALEHVGNATARLKVGGGYWYPKDLVVVYQAGHPIADGGDPGANVPDDIRHAIRMHAAQLYQFREPIIAGTIVAKVPNSLDDFYAQRSWEVGVG